MLLAQILLIDERMSNAVRVQTVSLGFAVATRGAGILISDIVSRVEADALWRLYGCPSYEVVEVRG